MSRLAAPAARIATGSVVIAGRLWVRAAAWVRRGRRDDLDGWRAALGCGLRAGLLVAVVYVGYRLARAVPALMWLLSASWLLASWHAGKPVQTSDAAVPAKASSGDPAEIVRTLLRDVMGDADTVHLRTVLQHLQAHGQWEGRTVTDLRRHLAHLGIPHDHRVKVGRVPTWGVRRSALDAPSPAPVEETSTAPSTAA
ncbi:hypothetical protein JHN63_02000 [Streptomyces sp. MBT65]|uniref:hypothetical protein n=1 Tax=Streptomyces sp. MBT65 TaxID=1488395 RepID=UPI00190D0F46|nr:hypothetical protein [Streptomyces sp. MBT65]MBK3572614.1 hypothetical protein [Streptomyces sp. MBT65]